jgi:type VI secretion system protein ImpC
MADRSRAGIEAEFTFGKGKRPAVDTGPAFRMLVVGDFGGHQARGEVRSLRDLRPHRVDLDSFASLLRALAPRVPVAVGDQPPFSVAIEEMEDFHPDRLFSKLEFFAPLRELRRQLQDGKAFARAAALLGEVSAPAAAPVAASADGDLLRLLGRPSTAASSAPGPASPVADLIRQAVAPHIVGKPDPRQAELVAALDGMTGELMRAVLHSPGFQRLEALWRGLDRLLRALELDEGLQVHVLDVSRDELSADLTASSNLADAAMYRVVVERDGAPPWAVVVNGNPCGRRQEDAALLGRLGALAHEIDAAVLTGLDASTWTTGFASLDDQRACAVLRNSTAARAIAAATPSVLLRLPYGKATDPIESFAFTEQTVPPDQERFLWGSSSFVLAELLARGYLAAGGWGFSPGDETVVGDMPVHTFAQEGESVETPTAQVWLTESMMDNLIKEGLTPVLSVRGRGEVRIPRFQSIASPAAALAGRWH